MSRLLHFTYDILLEFSRPVTRHSFVLRCLPPQLPGQQILDAELVLDPAVPFSVQRDGFGNLLQAGCIQDPHASFHYTARGWRCGTIPAGSRSPATRCSGWSPPTPGPTRT